MSKKDDVEDMPTAREHDVLIARADIALRAFKANPDGTIERVLSKDEIRAVLLPALGLPEDPPK